MLVYKQVNEEEELKAILALQQLNLKENISSTEKETQGFLTLVHDLPVLQSMHEKSPSIIDKKDDRLVYLGSKLGPKFDSVVNTRGEKTLIFIGDKACNGCVDIAFNKIYDANLNRKWKNVYLIFPDYYLESKSMIPNNIFIDSARLVNKTQFLSYFTVIQVLNSSVIEIDNLEYKDSDSLINNLNSL